MNIERTKKIQDSIIHSAITLTSSLSTSLGPRGTDKMIIKDGKTLITNDGATILKNLSYYHPINKLLANLSKNQDENCGDGTTSVVILTGSILKKCHELIKKGVHPTTIVKALDRVKLICYDYIEKVKIHVGDKMLNKERYHLYTNSSFRTGESIKVIDFSQKGVFKPGDIKVDGAHENVLDDLMRYRDSLLKSVNTSLSSKVVSSSSIEFSPIAVDAVLQAKGNLKNIRILKKVGGAVEDLRLSKSIVLKNNIKNPSLKGEKPDIEVFSKVVKFAILQFCVSPPKTNLDFKISIDDHSLMERIIKEEREYILNICKKIKQSGAELIIIQKSILRESLNELALHFLTRLDILVIDDVEREEVQYILDKFNLSPTVDPDFMCLSECEINEKREQEAIITELKCDIGCSIVVRGSDNIIVDEAERSLNDALCVVKCLFEEPYLLPGGGAVEIGIANALINESLRIKSGVPLKESNDEESNDNIKEKINTETESIHDYDTCELDEVDMINLENKYNGYDSSEINRIKDEMKYIHEKDTCELSEIENGEIKNTCYYDCMNEDKDDDNCEINRIKERIKHIHKKDVCESLEMEDNKTKEIHENDVYDLPSDSKSDENKSNDELTELIDEKINHCESYIFYEIGRAFDEIPYFLARNAGLDPVEKICLLRNKIKSENYPYFGINVRRNDVSCMIDENVVQPSKVTKSVISLAIETVSMIVKIDDILPSKR